MVGLIITLFVLAGAWRMFQKMGRQGWESIVPFYNTYVTCEVLYGNGWKMLLFLIPFYNIYFLFRFHIDLARAFNQGTGFGVGLVFLQVVFVPILGFGNAEYGDGTQAVWADDIISRTLDTLSSKMTGEDSQHAYEQQDQRVVRMLRELEELHQAGILTDEEFAAKKAELLQKI